LVKVEKQMKPLGIKKICFNLRNKKKEYLHLPMPIVTLIQKLITAMSLITMQKQLFWDMEDNEKINSFLNKIIRFETVLNTTNIFHGQNGTTLTWE
jgi:hypothetical protein